MIIQYHAIYRQNMVLTIEFKERVRVYEVCSEKTILVQSSCYFTSYETLSSIQLH